MQCARAGHLAMCHDEDKRLVALLDDVPVGFLVCRKGQLHTLFVAMAHRRRGVGGALVRALAKVHEGPVVSPPVDWALAEFFITQGWLPEEPKEIFFGRLLDELPPLMPVQGYRVAAAGNPHMFFAETYAGKAGIVETDPEGWVNRLEVAPEHQGKGVGAALLLISLYGLQAQGLPRALVRVRPENQAALELLRKFGFEMHEPRVIFRSP